MPTTTYNTVIDFGHITYALDPSFLNSGTQKKHIYHLLYNIMYL